jgi:hypothetical protein
VEAVVLRRVASWFVRAFVPRTRRLHVMGSPLGSTHDDPYGGTTRPACFLNVHRARIPRIGPHARVGRAAPAILRLTTTRILSGVAQG